MTRGMLNVKDIKCMHDGSRFDLKGEMTAPIANEAFINLVRSIKNKGLLLPIYVNKKKVIISGHYRFLAAKEANLDEVPIRLAETEGDVNYGED